MLSNEELHRQLEHTVRSTNFSFLGEKYEGKVRDCYVSGKQRILVTTDRLSCFDVVVTSVPFKGQVLNQLAAHWFRVTEDLARNHVIDIPDPNIMVVQSCEILPIEVVVRAYLAGSAWRDYQAGKAVSGVRLPPGLGSFQKLPEVIITPSTKAAKGSHDEPISEDQIVKGGLVAAKVWQEVRETSLSLFKRGQETAEARGLILVDTKYEFGLLDGRVVLADEIHTLDSSRYWIKQSYDQRLRDGEAPEMLDKEPTRQWLLERGYKGDGPVPEFTAEHRVQIARHYIDSYERISGRPFAGEVGPAAERMAAKLKEYAQAQGA
jgi:phosphoribosylaminoimidazole-succinocarboxamide synthase